MNKKGATSILIIFMLIVMVTLGSFAIVSANTNYRFSTVVTDRNRKFYGLEKKSEEFLMELDNIIVESQNITAEFMTNRGFQEAVSLFVDLGLQEKLNEMYNSLTNEPTNEEANVNEKADFNDIVNVVFTHILKNNLNELQRDYPGLVILTENDIDIFTEIDFVSDYDYNMFLFLRIKIQPINYFFYYIDDVVNKEQAGNSRFIVEARREWQRPAGLAGEM